MKVVEEIFVDIRLGLSLNTKLYNEGKGTPVLRLLTTGPIRVSSLLIDNYIQMLV